MHHEVVVRALLERFTVEVAVDVVLNLPTASRIDGVRFCRRHLVNCVADSVQPWSRWIGSNRVRKEREDQSR